VLGPADADLNAVEPGRRITEPAQHSNPIPGNHGHPITLPIAIVISGGWVTEAWPRWELPLSTTQNTRRAEA
jgi:hypothetical protein